MTTEIRVPDIGDFSDVEVIEVLVKKGDNVAQEDSLIAIESDKASIEIPSPQAGRVENVALQVGDKVSKDSLILTLEITDAPVKQVSSDQVQPTSEPEPESVETVEPQPTNASTEDTEQTSVIELLVPDIGDFTDVEVIEVLVKAGDNIAKEASLITLESDKASMEIPAEYAGVIQDVAVTVGDRVSAGDLIGSIQVQDTPTRSDVEVPDQPQVPLRPGDTHMKPDPVGSIPPARLTSGKAHASPTIRKFARELGVDIGKVLGTGQKGRITREDVQKFVKQILSQDMDTLAGKGIPPLPEIDFSQWGEIETVELGRFKKLSGPHLHRAWLNVPHVTQFDEADTTELEAFRQESKERAELQGIKLTFMSFLMKACATVLREMPEFNASLMPDGEHLVLKKYVHIGFAVDTSNGLVVPVIRDVDKKGVFDLAHELMALSQKARDGKLTPSDMQGGCFSISSLGGIGGTQFTPIVNTPEVAILGVSRAEMKAKWNGEAFEPRLVMPFALSYDHRVIDGAQGARFTTYLGGLLNDIRTLLL